MEFKNNIRANLIHIPDFIDQKSEIHEEVWCMMQEIDETLLELVSLSVLSDQKIGGIVNRFGQWTSECFRLLDSNERISLSVYYLAVLEWIMETALEGEYYETASNIKKFNEVYDSN